MHPETLGQFRRLHAGGADVRFMAAELHVSPTTIYRWLQAADLPTPAHVAHDFARRLAGHTVDQSGCLVWTGGVTAEGHPVVSVGNTTRTVRQMVLQMHQPPVAAGATVVIARCGTALCVKAEHLQAIPASAVSTLTAAAGNSPAGDRHWNAVLNWDTVDAIRASTESSRKLAARYQVSQATINSIRARRRWNNEAARTTHTSKAPATYRTLLN